MLEGMEVASAKKTIPARRIRSTAEKRQIVEETYRQGSSVRSIARAHDIPSNQVFHWRKLYREGRLGNAEQAAAPELVAVRVLEEQQRSGVEQATKQLAVNPISGMIQVQSEKGRLCIEGAVDPATLRMVLERLLG
jgi:transposase